MVISLGNTRVHHDAERQEHRVLGEEKNQEEPIDVTVGELVNQQVQNTKRLEREQGVHLVPAGLQLGIVPNTDDHVDCHHYDLQDNPTLL